MVKVRIEVVTHEAGPEKGSSLGKALGSGTLVEAVAVVAMMTAMAAFGEQRPLHQLQLLENITAESKLFIMVWEVRGRMREM